MRRSTDPAPTRLHILGSAPEPPAGVPAWAAKGFRPFFLLAGGFAALIVPVWLLALAGAVQLDAYVGAMYWHAHEMVFGFAAAVIAGFLLTAAGNWTGRETAAGGSLVALVGLWLAGRVAFAAASVLPGVVVACVDLAFLPALALVIGRALVAAGNRRNYPVLGVVVALWLANLAIHVVIGLGLRAAASVTGAVLVTSAVHALTVGAIGCTTLGMMARVALGHSGRPLVAPRSVAVAFGAVTAAAALRVLGPFALAAYPATIYASGALWTVGFAAFTACYAPILVRPRADGRPG